MNSKGSQTAAVLTGRPGMGKSMFGLYSVVRKILEVLTEQNQREEFQLIYVIGYWMMKITIPTVIPSNGDVSELVKSSILTKIGTWIAKFAYAL